MYVGVGSGSMMGASGLDSYISLAMTCFCMVYGSVSSFTGGKDAIFAAT